MIYIGENVNTCIDIFKVSVLLTMMSIQQVIIPVKNVSELSTILINILTKKQQLTNGTSFHLHEISIHVLTFSPM
jgi:hypothetical protein